MRLANFDFPDDESLNEIVCKRKLENTWLAQHKHFVKELQTCWQLMSSFDSWEKSFEILYWFYSHQLTRRTSQCALAFTF